MACLEKYLSCKHEDLFDAKPQVKSKTWWCTPVISGMYEGMCTCTYMNMYMHTHTQRGRQTDTEAQRHRNRDRHREKRRNKKERKEGKETT